MCHIKFVFDPYLDTFIPKSERVTAKVGRKLIIMTMIHLFRGRETQVIDEMEPHVSAGLDNSFPLLTWQINV